MTRDDVLYFAGIGLLTAGAGAMFAPAALLTAGLGVVIYALFVSPQPESEGDKS